MVFDIAEVARQLKGGLAVQAIDKADSTSTAFSSLPDMIGEIV